MEHATMNSCSTNEHQLKEQPEETGGVTYLGVTAISMKSFMQRHMEQ
jgi:hypothetical protein